MIHQQLVPSETLGGGGGEGVKMSLYNCDNRHIECENNMFTAKIFKLHQTKEHASILKHPMQVRCQRVNVSQFEANWYYTRSFGIGSKH